MSNSIAYSEEVTPEIFKEVSSAILMDSANEIISEFLTYREKRSGVYCFYSEEGIPLYVGQSSDIRNRIKSHCLLCSIPTKNVMPAIHHVNILLTDAGKEGLLEIEEDLIINFMPLFNGGLRGLSTADVYGFHNLRGWLNNNVDDYNVFPKEVIINKITEHDEKYLVERHATSKDRYLMSRIEYIKPLSGVTSENIIEKLENDSVTIYEDNFDQELTLKIPCRNNYEGASIYMLYDDAGTPLWCGATTDTRRVIKRHFRGNHISSKTFSDQITTVRIVYIGHERNIDGSVHSALDNLIEEIRPKYSKVRYRKGAKPATCSAEVLETDVVACAKENGGERTVAKSLREAIKIVSRNVGGDSADAIIDDLLSLMKYA